MKSPYEPYAPTKWEARIDTALRLFAPQFQFRRMLAREREHYFRYLSAQPSISRSNANLTTSGETMRGSREKLQVMWNAINCVDNSGLCTGLLTKFQTYVCGSLRFQARTGDRVINNEYEDYMRVKLEAIDLTGRFSFRQMCMLDVKSMLVKGDIGCNIVRQGNDVYLQGIEADRIGDPTDYRITDNYVRGLVLSPEGVIEAVKVYRRDRPSGTYVYDDTFPTRDQFGMPRFLFIVNPITYDDYRGISVFKTAIDNATYIDRMREYELQALMWAASQSGVYHTQSGLLLDQLPFDSGPPIDQSGNTLQTYEVRPNTVTALGVGENVTMFQHDRPSPNVIGMFRDTIRDIAVGTGLSYEFIWDQSGLSGPAVRAVSGADARAIEMWQTLMLEQKINPVTMLVLGNAIASGELPYHAQWRNWQWFFPRKGTIDVGRESQANIQEIAANINTGALVAAEDGQDINEIQFQRGRETEQLIQVAMVVAKNLSTASGEEIDWREIYGIMTPRQARGTAGTGGTGLPGGGGMGMGVSGGGGPAVRASPDGFGATDDGVDIEDSEAARYRRNGGGGSQLVIIEHRHKWYRENQARDEHGRFTDEGKGSQESGYKPPGGNGAGRPAAKDVHAELVKIREGKSKHNSAGDRFVHTDTDHFISRNAEHLTDFDSGGALHPDEDKSIRVRAREQLENRALIEAMAKSKTAEAAKIATAALETPETAAEHARNSPDLEPAKSAEDLPRFLADQEAHPVFKEMQAKLDKAASESPGGDIEQWSLARNSVGGKLTPEREALHQKITDETLNPNAAVKSGTRPNMILLLGQPGSGKSTAGEKLFANKIVPKENRTDINPDAIREKLPEYEGWNAPATQAESKLISDGKVLPAAITARHNILIDQSGSNTEKMERIVNQFGQKGYDVHIVHTSVPLHESANRIWNRFINTQKRTGKGRFVDPRYLVNAADGGPQRTYDLLKHNPYVKSYVSASNPAGGTPAVLDRSGGAVPE